MNSLLFFVAPNMMFDPTPMAIRKSTVTMAKCPAVTAVRISLAVLVSMIGSERSPGFWTLGSHAITITISSLPSSAISVQ